jgi:hypothetical protein
MSVLPVLPVSVSISGNDSNPSHFVIADVLEIDRVFNLLRSANTEMFMRRGDKSLFARGEGDLFVVNFASNGDQWSLLTERQSANADNEKLVTRAEMSSALSWFVSNNDRWPGMPWKRHV